MADPASGRRQSVILLAALGAVAAVVVVVSQLTAIGPEKPERPRVGTNVPVTATNLVRQTANNSPAIAVHPTDERISALANRLDSPDFSCALHLSFNTGKSWLPAQPVPLLPDGVEKCYAPEVAYDARGRLYYLFVGLHGPGNSPVGAYLTTSVDQGRSFSPPVRVLGPERYMVRMAIDTTMGKRGRIHMVWLEARSDPPSGGLPVPPNPIMAFHSDDGARTWSDPVQVNEPKRLRVVAPAIVIGPDHVLHVLYYDLMDDTRDYQGLEGPRWEGNWSLILSSSKADGREFGPGRVVDDQLLPSERVMLIFTMPPPSLAVDQAGRIFAAWHDARNGSWDAFVRRSEDGGRSWAPLQRLNDDPPTRLDKDPPTGLGLQYLPRLAVAPTGRIDVVFYDRRRDLANRRHDVYYTSSHDGGRSFEPNIRVTTESSSSLVGPRYAVASADELVELGSRLGLVSLQSGALAAWTDSRASSGAVAQDVFATDIKFPPRKTVSVSWILAVAIGLALVAAILVAVWRSRHAKMSGRVAPPPIDADEDVDMLTPCR